MAQVARRVVVSVVAALRSMLGVAMCKEKDLDDGDASMMMIIDETTMSMDDADKTLMMNDDELMMDDDETNKVKDETRIRCYPNE